MKTKSTTIKVEEKIKETEKAVQFNVRNGDKCWVPKSLIEDLDDYNMLTVPTWFYNKSKLKDIMYYGARQAYSNYMNQLANS